MEVCRNGGGYAVHATVEARHRCGEDARDNQSCDSFRELSDNVEGQYGIGGGEMGIEGFRMLGEENIEGCPDEKEE
jgi:hypothetical protein